ncbi:MAG: helicase [Alphaproteobacteria bacterium RIFCSPHIGHO2_12_FULL_63_12]|nr:MAG: helicase [Alphaproteobacteria bacterium RIFCSPHIGHO2_12_FULL_63_12]
MLLRPRQQLFVDRAVEAMTEHGNTLGVAPTGFGKTIALSAAVWRMLAPEQRAMILQHRDELVDQNRRTFHAVNKNAQTGVIDADRKEFHRPVAFAMVQTLAGAKNLEAMRPVDLLVVDEAHHAAAPSYLKIIDRARALNDKTRLFGLTATPNRGDKKALRGIFDNVADQVTLGELIAAGHLVRPRTFVVDIGVREELAHVRRTINDFDMDEVAKIMDKEILNETVVAKWKEVAGDRQTVVFCSNVDHARHVREAFALAGVAAGGVFGETGTAEREATLKSFAAGSLRVLVNVAVLTEGWDCPPTSCIVLLRPSSYKSTMIQMVGRGLRTIDPERYPGIVKTDCIVLDFGTSTLTHGSLEQDVDLDGGRKGEAPKKKCPECEALVPISAAECAICGHVFDVQNVDGQEAGAGGTLDRFTMTEIDLFDASPFKWEDLWGDGSVLVASAFDAWAMTIFYRGTTHAIGGAKGQGVTHLAVGDRMIALAQADDFLREHGDSEAAAKSRRWLHMPASDKQLAYLRIPREAAMGVTRYNAACHLTFRFNERGVRAKLQSVGMARAA